MNKFRVIIVLVLAIGCAAQETSPAQAQKPDQPQASTPSPTEKTTQPPADMPAATTAATEDTKAATKEATKAPATDTKATVYVYRYKQFVGSALEPSVYCDDVQLARMDNGRFFVAKIAPGHHMIRSNDKQSGIDVEFKAGQEYYVRIELATGFWKGHGRVVHVTPEQGAFEVKKLEPLGADKIVDKTVVVPGGKVGM
jgi:hypothetical protein